MSQTLSRGFALTALSLGLALTARAEVFGYEWVLQSGPNNVIDSTASCGFSGCYDKTGILCRSTPGSICNLQIVPAGRCSYGAPGSTCVWPHGAGHCANDPSIGCLSDAYLADPNDFFEGPSALCAGTGDSFCVMDEDPFGGLTREDCSCRGDNEQEALANELAVCGSPGGVCSDGDPDRDVGGYGLALGMEFYLGPPPFGGIAFPTLGPSVNGTSVPTTSPRYPIENPPTAVAPQRDPGTINRAVALPGPIHVAKTRLAFERTSLFPSLGVEKLRGIGKSFWADWTTDPGTISQTSLTTHAVPFACDPPLGWALDAKIDPTPGAQNSGDEAYCSQLSRDSVTVLWRRDLTPAEKAANPACPPTCGKDFDLTTTEYEAIQLASIQDKNAGLQLGIQSGEGRPAGAGDSISAAPITLMLWINGMGAGGSDLRCHLGGWGAFPDTRIGRCSDGPMACRPLDPVDGDALCAAQSAGQCRACNGPIDYGNPDTSNGLPNALGLPPGYDPQGLSVLQLDKSERIGGIAGVGASARIPLFLIGTSGYAASDFRDTPGTVAGSLDVADLGQVDPFGDPFSVGIGTGGTFTNGSALPIGAPCCAGGANVSWSPAQVGTPSFGTSFLRTFDSGPGLDGIPGCFGDNAYSGNGGNACNQHLGQGPVGPKTDGFYATGLDDVPVVLPVGASGPIPASSARFPARWPVDGSCPLPAGAKPVFNQVHALASRDSNVIATANTDLLLKLNVTYCPAVGANSHDCAVATSPPDADCDGIADASDNCPTVPNGLAQAGVPNVGNQTDTDGDAVGDACDNCRTFANPRVTPSTAAFLTSNPWATLTGGQRDDDHDGYGNKCDGKFPGVLGIFVHNGDLNQFRASNTRNRTLDLCGTTQTGPCAVFDLDESGLFIGNGDLIQWRLLNTKAPGPKCPTCPLTCTAGTAGTCS